MSMAHPIVWYYTNLPSEMVDILSKDLLSFDPSFEESRVLNGNLNKKIRNSKNTWVPTSHWTSGFLWFYVDKINNENFLYDLTNIDGENLQYTQYSVGEKYDWHTDDDISSHYKPNVDTNRNINGSIDDFLNTSVEKVRKLSFVLQLSDYDEYEGGNLQILTDNNKLVVAPRKRGTLIAFDSRYRHRVTKVTKGTRKSIVGWVVGPRWK